MTEIAFNSTAVYGNRAAVEASAQQFFNQLGPEGQQRYQRMATSFLRRASMLAVQTAVGFTSR
jgi:hypothetical protein